MASYDPFVRGRFPVGVTSVEFTDDSRERRLPVEVWYPAAESCRGQDLDPATQDRYSMAPTFPKVRQAAARDLERAEGVWPLVFFSHGFAGHRRQTTHFCAHLCSHGYLVASVDHVGNAMPDIMRLVAEAQKGGSGFEVGKYLAEMATARPLDVSFVIDSALAGEFGSSIDPERIGMTGHSFGGWTTLAATAADERIRAALPLAPGGGRSESLPMANMLNRGLTLDWQREVPTLLLAADLDSLLPLDGMRELYGRVPAPKTMVTLLNADHFHFCDMVEQTHDLFRKMGGLTGGLAPGAEAAPDPMKSAKPSSELVPGKDAYAFLQGLGLAHMDAYLKDTAAARRLLAADVEGLLAGRGIKVEVVRG